jgi:hypothetical protein
MLRYMGKATLTIPVNCVCSLPIFTTSVLNSHNCSLETPYLSCSAMAHPNVTDSCCTETFGGLVLSTQFWNTYTGLESQSQVLPKNTWTLHGLWPDFCNGSYTQYCDLKYVPLFTADFKTLTKPFSKPTIWPFTVTKYHNRHPLRHSCPTLHGS